jgi:hypothetical protein
MDDWQWVIDALTNHHHKPDLEAARALYSAIAAHRFNGAPVWPMIVAPPGSMKTVLLEALDGLPGCHFVDKLTPNTFLSGQIQHSRQKSARSPSLLHRIGKTGILIYADFSTILAMNRDHRNAILADMRRIYDGKLTREFGTTERPAERVWEGRLTFAAAATPALDSYFSVFQSLGERFVLIRPARPDGVESAIRAIKQDRIKAKQEVREAVRNLFDEMPDFEPEISQENLEGIAALAEFTVRARTHVPRSGYGNKQIEYVPEPEAPTRLGQQLAQLAKGSALIACRCEVKTEDLMLVRRVALDCVPAIRRKILTALIAFEDLAKIDLPPSTRQYATEELEALKLVKKHGSNGVLSDFAADLLVNAGYWTDR